jgi:hypothetical protein
VCECVGVWVGVWVYVCVCVSSGLFEPQVKPQAEGPPILLYSHNPAARVSVRPFADYHSALDPTPHLPCPLTPKTAVADISMPALRLSSFFPFPWDEYAIVLDVVR